MQKRFYYITKPILVLSLVSLFTDMASEMLYPIMPIYLQSIGFSVILIGLLEGFAETIAGLSKGYFGQLSDIKQRRLPFVRYGYSLSAISKPLMAIFTYPWWVFFARTLDRIGKGLRTAPRDAILSLNSTKENKAKVFGFHRAMDTFGAVIGPSIALIFLFYYPLHYRNLFVLAFIPGVLAILSTFLVKEERKKPQQDKKITFFSFFSYLFTFKKDDQTTTEDISYRKQYRKLVLGLLIFAIVNSSDVFLLLKMKDAGLNDTYVILIYIFYNLIYALSSFPAGVIADKLGLKKTFITGLILFTGVYAGFSINNSMIIFWLLFLLYGIYAACTEGIAKAWISNIAPPSETGTAIGTYTAFVSIASFAASTIAGIIWYSAGPGYAFAVTAIATAFLVIYFSTLKEK